MFMRRTVCGSTPSRSLTTASVYSGSLGSSSRFCQSGGHAIGTPKSLRSELPIAGRSAARLVVAPDSSDGDRRLILRFRRADFDATGLGGLAQWDPEREHPARIVGVDVLGIELVAEHQPAGDRSCEPFPDQ